VKRGGPKNVVASIQARLVQRSHELDVEHQLTLARFGGERLRKTGSGLDATPSLR